MKYRGFFILLNSSRIEFVAQPLYYIIYHILVHIHILYIIFFYNHFFGLHQDCIKETFQNEKS